MILRFIAVGNPVAIEEGSACDPKCERCGLCLENASHPGSDVQAELEGRQELHQSRKPHVEPPLELGDLALLDAGPGCDVRLRQTQCGSASLQLLEKGRELVHVIIDYPCIIRLVKLTKTWIVSSVPILDARPWKQSRPSSPRPLLCDTIPPELLAPHTGEPEATAWAFAAITALGLHPSVLFHPAGYQGKSAGLILTFTSGGYPGAATGMRA